MHIAIITRNVPPEFCGLGDHSLMLSQALSKCGHQITILAGRGEPQNNIRIISDDWTYQGLSLFFKELERLKIDHLILQYTPLAFEMKKGCQNYDLKDFWQLCTQHWSTSLILHETYFLQWNYPPSWLKGIQQKQLLYTLVDLSNYVFTASELLVNELKYKNSFGKIIRLPISSNFPFIPVNRNQIRKQYDISTDEIVLTLFRKGGKWLTNYINDLDIYLKQHQIKVKWLLLGGTPPEWFNFSFPYISPGWLPAEKLSECLQMTDIFLVAYTSGLSSKRGTVMAALQHGLPIVGVSGIMTDPFWQNLSGVTLVKHKGSSKFCHSVLNLCKNEQLRLNKGTYNQEFYQQFLTPEKIVNILLKTITK